MFLIIYPMWKESYITIDYNLIVLIFKHSVNFEYNVLTVTVNSGYPQDSYIINQINQWSQH